MATLHIYDVSDDAVTTLKVRATRAGQPLQTYVRRILEAEAEALTPEEATDHARTIAKRSSVTADDVVQTIMDMRA